MREDLSLFMFPLKCAMKLNTDIITEIEVAQLCPTLCYPMDHSLPGSSVHGIFQAIVKASDKVQKSKLPLRSKMGAVVGVITF